MEEGQHEVVEDQEEEGQDKDSGMEGKEAGRRREARRTTGLEPEWIWSFRGRGTPPLPRTTSHSLRLLGHKTLGEIPSRQLPPPGSPRGPSRRSTRVASVHSSAEKGLSVSLGLGDPHHPSEQGLWAARFSKLMGKPEANRDTVPSGVRRSPQLSLSRSRGGGCLAQEPSPTGLLGTGASVPGAPSLRPSRQGGR